MLDFTLIEQARKEKRVHVFKNAFPNTPSITDFLVVLDKYITKDLVDFPTREHIKTKNLNEEYLSFDLRCRFWSRFTFQLSDHLDPIEKQFKELDPIWNWAKEIYGDRLRNAFALISLVANKGHIGSKHSDYVDQFQWQCTGESIWRTGENLEHEVKIEPGDFIFIPKDLEHEIETFVTPRAVINLVIKDEE